MGASELAPLTGMWDPCVACAVLIDGWDTGQGVESGFWAQGGNHFSLLPSDPTASKDNLEDVFTNQAMHTRAFGHSGTQ